MHKNQPETQWPLTGECPCADKGCPKLDCEIDTPVCGLDGKTHANGCPFKERTMRKPTRHIQWPQWRKCPCADKGWPKLDYTKSTHLLVLIWFTRLMPMVACLRANNAKTDQTTTMACEGNALAPIKNVQIVLALRTIERIVVRW